MSCAAAVMSSGDDDSTRSATESRDSEFPVKYTVSASVINGNHTDVAILEYRDRVMVIVTQFEKIGCMVQVTQSKIPERHATSVYNTKIVLGEDKVELHAIARHIAERLNTDKALLFGLTLKDFEHATVRAVAKLVADAYAKMTNTDDST